MIIDLNIQANREHVRVSSPQIDLVYDEKNIIAYRTDGKGRRRIVSVGMSVADMAQAKLGHGLVADADLIFVYPFDTDRFSAEFAIQFLEYYAILMVWKKRPPIGGIQPDAVRINLFIEGYDRLSLAERQEFEYALPGAMVVKVKGLEVNGGSSLTPEFMAQKQRERRVVAVLHLLVNIFILIAGMGWFGVWQLAVVPYATSKPLNSTDIPVLYLLLFLVIFVIGFSIILQISTILSVLIWVRVYRSRLPLMVLKQMLSRERLGLLRTITTWLNKRLLTEPTNEKV